MSTITVRIGTNVVTMTKDGNIINSRPIDDFTRGMWRSFAKANAKQRRAALNFVEVATTVIVSDGPAPHRADDDGLVMPAGADTAFAFDPWVID